MLDCNQEKMVTYIYTKQKPMIPEYKTSLAFLPVVTTITASLQVALKQLIVYLANMFHLWVLVSGVIRL